MSATAKQTIKLKKLSKYNTTWHPESTLVFKSPGTGKDKVVIGRLVDEDLVSLDDDCITLCETWNFKPDPDLVADSENDDQSQTNQSEQQDADESPEDEKEDCEPDPEPLEEESKGVTDTLEEVEPVPIDSKTESSSVDVKPVLLTFQGEVDGVVKELSKTLLPIFSGLEARIADLESQLAEKSREKEELESKYNVINQKFVAMKSLFN